MNQWQKIETFDFPEFTEKTWYQNSRLVLLFEKPNIKLGWYQYTRKGKGRWKSIEGYIIHDPSHWMELPDAPEDGDG